MKLEQRVSGPRDDERSVVLVLLAASALWLLAYATGYNAGLQRMGQQYADDRARFERELRRPAP